MDGLGFLLIAITVIPLVFFIKSYTTAQKKEKYMAAIARGDKSAALILGREYYASMRSNGKLTIYDEQAIANDLSTMK